MRGSPSQNCFRHCDDVLRLKAEFFEYGFEWSRSAEAVHADHLAFGTDVSFPSECGCHLNGNPRSDRRGEHAFLVGGVLRLEELPRGHAYDAGFHTFGAQFFPGGDAQRNFAPGSDENYLRLSTRGIGKDVSALRHARGRTEFRAIECGQSLTREHEGRGAVGITHDESV